MPPRPEGPWHPPHLAAYCVWRVISAALLRVCYAMLAYAVNTLVKEIGVRLALGATTKEIARMVVSDGLIVGVPGIAIGIAAAMSSVQMIQSQLYGVEPRDPWAVLFASITFLVIVLIASLFPAMRACRTNPVEALAQRQNA